MEYNDDKFSVYNDAIGQINRLNNIWVRCNRLAKEGDLISWNYELDCGYRELSSDITEFKLKEEEAKYKAINKMMIKCKNHRNKTYKLLVMKDTLLRRIQDVVGKGARREEKMDQLM